jgi:hemolysin activation/secretion protein
MHHRARQTTYRTLAVVLGLFLIGLSAQAADIALPNAGTLLQDAKPQPTVPGPQGDSPLRLLPTPEAGLPMGASFMVHRIDITGNTLFDTALLHALVAPVKGQRLSLGQLNEAIAVVTEFYRGAGYPLARAIIPAQAIEDGVVTIEVIEGRLGDIVLDNQSVVDSAFLQKTLSSLQRGDVISQTALDRALLLLSDLPGIVPKALLKPGEAVGSSDLAVEVQPSASVRGDVLLDNHGSIYTGRDRINATLQWNNPLHRGDVLGLSALSSGSRLNYARLNYELSLDGQGSYAGAAASTLRYTLGDSAASLQAHGSAQQGSVWWRRYLVRSQEGNLGLRVQYDPMTLRDDVDSTATFNDRRVKLWSIEAQADASDSWLSGGYTSATLVLRSGRVRFDDAVAESADAQTAKVQGYFTHWGLTLARTQALGSSTNVALSFTGQWARHNLDASQKFSIGGARNVRAYESGVLSGDSGQTLSLELRQMLPVPGDAGVGQWQLIAFWDAGRVKVNQNPWKAEDNHAFIRGAGLGLNWQGPGQWRARITYARSLGDVPAQLAGSAARHQSAWLELGTGF